jgi:transcription elongation factor SPT6
MSARDLIDDRALEDEDEEDESFDEETGDVRERPDSTANRFDDSSEEDDDDDDEEAAAEVGTSGFHYSRHISDFDDCVGCKRLYRRRRRRRRRDSS